MDETQTVLLQVVVGVVTIDEDAALAHRFKRFYNPESGAIEYPVSCDSHGFDVFRDEFEDTKIPVDFAALVVLPYPPEHFVPFSEESAGWGIAEWDDNKWNFPNDTACTTA